MNKQDRQSNIDTTKSHDNRKDANVNLNSISSLSIEHVGWAVKKNAIGAAITMPSFANDFRFYSEEDAESAFSSILSSSNIPGATRIRLQERYEVSIFSDQYYPEKNSRGGRRRNSATRRIAKRLILEEANNLGQSMEDSDDYESSNTDGLNSSRRATSPLTIVDILDSEENQPLASPLPLRRNLQDGDGTTREDKTINRTQNDNQDAHPEAEQAADLAHSEDSLDLEEIDDLIALITSIKHSECDKDPCWHIRSLDPTVRMTKIFTKRRLKKIRDTLTKKVDAIDIEDAVVLRSIR
ncbi:hypothetical protein EC991_004642, partial [Linnemannia zychae]